MPNVHVAFRANGCEGTRSPYQQENGALEPTVLVRFASEARYEIQDSQVRRARAFHESENYTELFRDIIKIMIYTGQRKTNVFSMEWREAVASGGKWLGHQCKRGRVLWIDCELHKEEAQMRLKDIYKANGASVDSEESISLWSLRGKTKGLEQMLESMLLRTPKDQYELIIIDPIYKLMSGDENAVGDNRSFTEALDKLTEASGAAVVYSHHHRKGALGGDRSRLIEVQGQAFSDVILMRRLI